MGAKWHRIEARVRKEIREIFNHNTFILSLTDKVIYYFRIQNYDAALRNNTVIIDNLSLWIGEVENALVYLNNEQIVIDMNQIMNMLTGLLNAQENEDYVLLADLLELQLEPLLYKIQEFIVGNSEKEKYEENYKKNIEKIKKIDKELEKELLNYPLSIEQIMKRCSIEYTSSGLNTVAITTNNQSFYLHSNKNPQTEGFILANSWYKEGKTEYIIYGIGLAYHIFELSLIDSEIDIQVYESDKYVIGAMCASGDIKKLLDIKNVSIHYDKDLIKLAKRLKTATDKTELVVHYPSLRCMENLVLKEKIEEYFIQYSATKNQGKILDGNFRYNIEHYDAVIDELEEKFIGKDLYVIAAGPSLDKNIEELKNIGNDGIIMATGTVLRKLLNAGIVPDYTIVSDANSRIYAQISGLEECNVPLLILSTAYKGFMEFYKGKKNIIFQEGYEEAEKIVKEKKFKLFKVGGSVSTIAIDIGIEFKCSRIITVGLDLAYTDDYAHTTGTSRRNANTENMKQITDVNGKLVKTTKSLDMYRRWIEKRIASVNGIEFIDATEGGALIHGMKVKKLVEIIKKF